MNNLTLIIPAKDEKESLPSVIDSINYLDCQIIVSLKEDDFEKKNSYMDKMKEDNEAARVSGDVWEIAKDYFLQYAINIPQDELNIDPINYTITMYHLLTNKHKINVQSRRGRIYSWTGTAIRGLKSLVTN